MEELAVNELRKGNGGDGSSLLSMRGCRGWWTLPSMSCCSCRGWRNLTVDQGMQGMEMEEVQPVHRDADEGQARAARAQCRFSRDKKQWIEELERRRQKREAAVKP
jgi:predicted esterase